MANDGVNWDGLLKWSIAHSDGSRRNRNLSEEDRKWFMEAMQAQTIDVVKRMKEITQVMQTPVEVLESQGVKPDDIEDMLDELQEHVESLDMANDLHTIGGLAPLLGYLKSSHAGIRAKAADVLTTIVQNNPKSQQLVMEANGMEHLFANFSSDPDITCRTKALGAISSLIRHNKPGTAAFRLANGFAVLRDALCTENLRFQRKALNLLQYLLHENTSDCSVVVELGFPRLMIHLFSGSDFAVREAALHGLLELAYNGSPEIHAVLTGEASKLKQILQSRIGEVISMSHEDLRAAKEERQLIDSLWKACFNEASDLHKKGLVVLPGEDAPPPPPDVVGKLFEPPLRAWAAPKAMESKKTDGDKESPLLLGPGPSGGPS